MPRCRLLLVNPKNPNVYSIKLSINFASMCPAMIDISSHAQPVTRFVPEWLEARARAIDETHERNERVGSCLNLGTLKFRLGVRGSKREGERERENEKR